MSPKGGEIMRAKGPYLSWINLNLGGKNRWEQVKNGSSYIIGDVTKSTWNVLLPGKEDVMATNNLSAGPNMHIMFLPNKLVFDCYAGWLVIFESTFMVVAVMFKFVHWLNRLYPCCLPSSKIMAWCAVHNGVLWFTCISWSSMFTCRSILWLALA